MVEGICILAALGVHSWRDIKKREISLGALGGFVLAGIIVTVCSLIQGERNLTEVLAAFLPGGFLLLLSKATQGAAGMGDGWILLSLGLMLDFLECLTVLVAGLFFAGGYGGYLYLVKKKSKKTEIPFIPFLLAGYVWELVLWNL